MEELRGSNPQLAELVAPRSARLADIQAILTPGQALLRFTLGDPSSHLWIVCSSSVQLIPVGGAMRIDTEVQRLRTALASPQAPRRFVPPARCLYGLLFGGADAILEPHSEWILALDGPLAFVPSTSS